MKKEKAKRLAPEKDTLSLLFSLSGNVCAFPGCDHPIFNEKNKLIAQVCHIEAALEGGERHNENSSNEDRRKFENLLVLCYAHHIETDDVDLYTVEKMQELKSNHETQFRGQFKPTQQQIDIAFEIELKNTLGRIEVNTEKILQNQALQTGDIGDIKGTLALFAAKFDISLPSSGDFNKELDEIFEYKSKGQQRTCLVLFAKFKEKNWDKLSDHDKYRLYALMGLCHIDLMENEEASKLFLEGLEYQPDNPKAINFAIIGYNILGDFEASKTLIEKGLEIDPNNVGIIASMIRSDQNRTLEELLASIPNELHNNPEIAFNIALSCNKKGNYEDSITWAKISLKNTKDSFYEIKGILATFILESIFDKDMAFSGQISQDVETRAQYIIELYTEAWTEVSQTDLRLPRTWYLLNRGIAKKLTGDMDGYYEDSFAAQQVDPSYHNLLHFLQVALELNKIKIGTETISKLRLIAKAEDLHELDHFESQFFTADEKYEEAIQKLKDLLSVDLTAKLRKFVLLDLVSIYNGLKNFDLADEALKLFDQDYSNEISYLILKARVDDELGKHSLLEGLLFAKAKVGINTSKHEIGILAAEFARQNRHSEAIELYEMVTDLEVYSERSGRLLHAYYLAGENQKLLTAASKLLEIYGPIRQCTELVFYVYEKIKDFEKAIGTCKDYLEVYPNDQQIRYRLVCLLSNNNKSAELKRELLHFDYLDENLDMNMQYHLAVLIHQNGQYEKAYNFAYETRRRFFESSKAHDKFIGLSIELEQDNKQPDNPELVNNDCAVYVAMEGGINSFIIEKREDYIRSRGEVSHLSFEAKQLVGRKTGDKVCISKNHPDRVVEIIAIMHKFNFGFKESMQLIGETFANESSLRQFTIGNTGDFKNDFKALFDGLDAAEESNARIEQYYHSGTFPIGAIAELKSVNPINIWRQFISDSRFGIKTFGDLSELPKANELLTTGAPVILDVLALCTIFEIGLTEILTNSETELIIVQSSMDVVRRLIVDLEKSKYTGTMTLGKGNGNYIRHIETPEDVQSQILYFEKLECWAKSNCKIVPCEASLSINSHKKEEYDELLGESFVDSVLAAKERGGILYSEEGSMRHLALHEFQVPGIASFMIAVLLQQNQIIDKTKYREITIKLFGLNYHSIPIGPMVVFEAARTTNYQLVSPLLNVMEGVICEFYTGDQSVSVMFNFITLIYTQPIQFIALTDVKNLQRDILIKALEILAKKFRPDSFQAPLIKLFMQNSALKQEHKLEIAEIIKNFCRKI
ncbi:tetratricopeptide (TPR) repeat protein [Pedobacter cryoconitis]|uniref:tetratricopeptide repeat protein n=1 Tax=Pedobacter cryoconitis TaxID=188932 RepID=UPI00161E9272|nr:hypothetical protein [Pedobacter cryoconitis]MBB6271901.1 tetratricopeptide (TPR) repeat protein [Pedobacter cryoconitis]